MTHETDERLQSFRSIAGLLAGALLLIVPAAMAAGEGSPAPQSRQLDGRPAVGDDYKIGARDVLQISVFGIDQLNTSVRVAEDGRISLPLIGDIGATGLTRGELEDAIESALARYVTEPQVAVFISEYQSQRISVIGAVHSPGTIEMVGRMSLLEAISNAGGIDYTDSAGMVTVLRSSLTGAPLQIDLDDLLRRGDATLNIGLEAGDTVNVVPKDVYFIYVYGRVRTPGSYELRASVTLLQAVSLAGGLADRAARDRIIILRRKPDGTQERIRVNLQDIIDGKRADFPILANDVVIVQETFF